MSGLSPSLAFGQHRWVNYTELLVISHSLVFIILFLAFFCAELCLQIDDLPLEGPDPIDNLLELYLVPPLLALSMLLSGIGTFFSKLLSGGRRFVK